MDELKPINLVETAESADNISESKEEITPMQPTKNKFLLPLVLIGILAGVATGFFIAQRRLSVAGGATSTNSTPQELTSATNIKVGDTFGSADEKTFRDQAEGILATGGIDGEGSHHIERGDNKSQWVYVTSSVVDLDLLVGDRVAVWGETNQGKKAGWLMDVGRLKVLELNVGQAPTDSAEQE